MNMYSAPILMPMSTSQQRIKEKFDSKVMFTLQPSLERRLDDFATENNDGNRSEVIRQALEAFFNPRPSQISNEDLQSNALLDVTVACGEPSEAREDATPFTISEETAVEVRRSSDDDFWVRSRGDSMEGRGILEEQLILIEPLPSRKLPRRGDIALIRVSYEDGETKGTLKVWNGLDSNGAPKLLDGEGKEFHLSGEITSAVPIGIAKGVIGAL